MFNCLWFWGLSNAPSVAITTTMQWARWSCRHQFDFMPIGSDPTRKLNNLVSEIYFANITNDSDSMWNSSIWIIQEELLSPYRLMCKCETTYAYGWDNQAVILHTCLVFSWTRLIWWVTQWVIHVLKKIKIGRSYTSNRMGFYWKVNCCLFG